MKPYLKYGLLAALVCIIASIIVTIGKLQSPAVSFVVNVLTYTAVAAAIIIALREKRARQGDYLSYSQGVGEGMRVATVAGLATGLAYYINVKFINHSLTQTMYENYERDVYDRMEKMNSSEVDEEQVDFFLKFGKMLLAPAGQSFIVLLGYMVLGLIISLIVAAVLRKEDGNNLFNNPMYGPRNDNGASA